MALNDRSLTSQKDGLSNSLNLVDEKKKKTNKTKKTIASLQAVPFSLRASLSRAHLDFPPFLRPATQVSTLLRGTNMAAVK